MSTRRPDPARAGVTCLGSAVGIVLGVVLVAAVVDVAGWLALLLIVVIAGLPVWRLSCASRRRDVAALGSTTDNDPKTDLEQ